MTPGDPHSYLELCIAALPPEKREAARRAFYEISEMGDDSYLSKLLAVLEANGAYAKRIPKEMTEAGAEVVREMEDIGSRLVGAEVRREASFKSTITSETARLVESLPVRQIESGIERQNELLERLRKAAVKIDTGVGSGLVVFLVIIAFAAGIGVPAWYYWDNYQEFQVTKRFLNATNDAGIQMRITPTETGTQFIVTGPCIKAANFHDLHKGTTDWLIVEFDKPQ